MANPNITRPDGGPWPISEWKPLDMVPCCTGCAKPDEELKTRAQGFCRRCGKLTTGWLAAPPADSLYCAVCVSTAILTTNEPDDLTYGVGAAAVKLSVVVPVRRCEACGFTFTDHEAEDIRAKAVQDHLEKISADARG